MRLLFVCSRNRLRSPTAETLFSKFPGVETASAGTSPDADNPISTDLLDWADIVFVMENVHRKRLNASFKAVLKAKKVVVLGIPDKYEYMDAQLIKVLKTKLVRYIKT
jgi:predicted protein tyrosine phosphatase